jgi:hypothetical protein
MGCAKNRLSDEAIIAAIGIDANNFSRQAEEWKFGAKSKHIFIN